MILVMVKARNVIETSRNLQAIKTVVVAVESAA
jgi:hypothetical protein